MTTTAEVEVGTGAPRRLADAITRVRDELANSLFSQAVVTGTSGYGVTVNMAGSVSTWPYVNGYVPRVGDVVIMGGTPGSWVCLGTISNIGARTASFYDLNVGQDLLVARDINAGEDIIANANMSCTSLIASLDINAQQDLIAGANITGRSVVADLDIHAKQDLLAWGNVTGRSMIADLDIHAKEDLLAWGNVTGRSMIADIDINAKQDLIANANLACRSVVASVDVNVSGSVGVVYNVGCTRLNTYKVWCMGDVGAYTFNGAPSSRSLKRNIQPVEDSALEAVAGTPQYWWQYKVGAIEEADAEKWRKGPMADDLPSDALVDTDNGPAPELVTMINYAWAAIGELKTVVDTQAATIEALTARVEALEAVAS